MIYEGQVGHAGSVPFIMVQSVKDLLFWFIETSVNLPGWPPKPTGLEGFYGKSPGF